MFFHGYVLSQHSCYFSKYYLQFVGYSKAAHTERTLCEMAERTSGSRLFTRQKFHTEKYNFHQVSNLRKSRVLSFTALQVNNSSTVLIKMLSQTIVCTSAVISRDVPRNFSEGGTQHIKSIKNVCY